MPRNRSLFSGRTKSASEAPESDLDSLSRASTSTPNANGRVAATLPRDYNPDAVNQQRRHSLRHSLGRTLSSLFSSSNNASKQQQQQQFQQQQLQQYLEQQQQQQQQQQIQVLLEQQQQQHQQMHLYLEQQQQQQQQILAYLQDQQKMQSSRSPQPEMLVYYGQQTPPNLETSAYEVPNTDAATPLQQAELQQKQVERQQLQQRLAQQQQQLQQLALRAANHQQQQTPPQTPPQPRLQTTASTPPQRRPEPFQRQQQARMQMSEPPQPMFLQRQQPPLQHQLSEPTQRRPHVQISAPPELQNQQPGYDPHRQNQQPLLQHQLSEPLQRGPHVLVQRPPEAPTPPQRRQQLQHQQRVSEGEDGPPTPTSPMPRMGTLTRSESQAEGRPGLRRLTPKPAPQRQFSGEGEGRGGRSRALEAPAIRLRKSKNLEPRPQSCSRASFRSDANSIASGPSAARSFTNIKSDGGSNNGEMPKIRYSSTFIRKSVGDDLSASPTADSAFVVCDIPDGETEDGVAHFVTLRKSKRKGLNRNASTVERKEAYGKENPASRPKSVSLSSNNSGNNNNHCTRYQKKAPTMLMDNL